MDKVMNRHHTTTAAAMRHFTAPWSRSLHWISWFTTTVCVLVAFFSPTRHFAFPQPWLEPFTAAVPLIVLLTSAPFIIRGYTLTQDALLIHRLLWNTRVPLQGLISAEVKPDAMRRSMRVCGNGGLYSFTGWFWRKDIGRFSAYVTDLNRTVVLRFKNRTIILSPGTPDDFVAALSLHLPLTPP